MKGVVTIAVTYELPQEENLEQCYGTTDPMECVQIDANNDLPDLLMFADDVTIVDIAVVP